MKQEFIEKIIEEYKKWMNVDYYDMRHKPKTFEEAVAFFNFWNKRGEDPQWSIQYYGFGEHLTFWSGYGGFIDFDIDNGTAISWGRLKEIIIESAQSLWEDLRKNKKHLFKRWSIGTKKVRKDENNTSCK